MFVAILVLAWCPVRNGWALPEEVSNPTRYVIVPCLQDLSDNDANDWREDPRHAALVAR